MKKRLTLTIVGILLLLVVVCIVLCATFSLRPSVVASIRAEDAQVDNGTGAMVDVELFPSLGLPFQVTALTARDTTAETDLSVQSYVHNNDSSPWFGTAQLFSAAEAADLAQQNVLLPLDASTLSGEGNWLVVLFPGQAPPQSHTVQLELSYRLFGLFPKTETFPCAWL